MVRYDFSSKERGEGVNPYTICVVFCEWTSSRSTAEGGGECGARRARRASRWWVGTELVVVRIVESQGGGLAFRSGEVLLDNSRLSKNTRVNINLQKTVSIYTVHNRRHHSSCTTKPSPVCCWECRQHSSVLITHRLAGCSRTQQRQRVFLHASKLPATRNVRLNAPPLSHKHPP